MELTKELVNQIVKPQKNQTINTNKKGIDAEQQARDLLLSETVINNAPRIGRSKKMIADIPISLLRIDDTYQRCISNNVKKLMLNWDEDKCTALIVSYRDGYFWIMDGQHRYTVASKLGLSHLVCEVFQGLTVEDEAKIFARQNENITRLTTYDTFKANLVFHEEIDTVIKSVCDEYGIAVKQSSSPKTLKSVSSARSIVKKDGSFTLQWIFSVISDANWEDFKEPLSGDWLEGLYYVYQKNRTNLVDIKKNLVHTLSHSNPVQVVSYGNATNPTLGRRMRLKVALDKIAKGECTVDDMNAVFA